MTPPRLAAHGLGWSTPAGVPVLSGIDLEVPWARVGLVGRNGAGKSTLLGLLAGARAPTAGRVVCTGTRAHLPQRLRLAPAATLAHILGVADTLAALRRMDTGAGRPEDLARIGDDWDLEDRVARLLDALGLGHLGLDRQAATLSGGEQLRTALAARLLQRPDWLLLDEPSNHLDLPAKDRLVAMLRDWPGGLLLASHDRELLEVVDTVVEVDGGGVALYGMGFAGWQAAREAAREAARREAARAETALDQARRRAQLLHDRQQRKSARGQRARGDGSQPAMVRNAQRARAERSTGRLGTALGDRVSTAAAAAEAARAQLPDELALRVDLSTTTVRSRALVVETRDAVARLGADAPGPGFTLGPVSLRIEGPERVGILGANGAGKSTLLALLAGHRAPDQGTIQRGPLRWGWLDQHADFLRPPASAGAPPAAESILHTLLRLHPSLGIADARWWLDRFGMSRHVVDRPVPVLSGGERTRVALACLLAGPTPPQVLVLDEPTNNLDLDHVALLGAQLQDYAGALLVVTHDRAFLSALGVGRCLWVARTGAASTVEVHAGPPPTDGTRHGSPVTPPPVGG